MKVLHSAFSRSLSVGIANQMSFEQLAADSMSLDWSCLLFISSIDDKSSVEDFKIIKILDTKSWIRSKLEYYKQLKTITNEYDIILLRYCTADPLQYLFLKAIKKPVYLVHHTLESHEISSEYSLKSIIKRAIEDVFGKLSLRAATGIVAVTNEIFDYESYRSNRSFDKRIIYPNGIITNTETLIDQRDSLTPEIIFLASDFVPWHGLDLLLEDLNNTSSNFILHIVGHVSSTDIQLANNDNRVVFHGILSSEDLNILMQRCWVGLSSFALNRKKMGEACTLKVREYLSNGIPVYSGHKDIFQNDFSFYKIGQPYFKDIVQYAHETRSTSKNRIRDLSVPFIDKRHLLLNLSKKLKETS